MDEIITLDVLAGAYRGGRKNLQATLTHSVAEYVEGGKSLCGKISVENLSDRYADEEGNNFPPTCKACLRKDPRF